MPSHTYWTGAKFASLVAKESVKGTALGIVLAIPYKLIEMDSTKKRVENFYKNYNPSK